MKKIVLVAIMAITALSASAQVDKGFRMGIRANCGLSNIVGKGDKIAFGYGWGLVAEYNFNPNLFLQSGIGMENIAHNEDAIAGTINAFYGQLPIHFGYRFGLGDKSSLFVQAGPTLGYGIFSSKLISTSGEEFNFLERVDNRFDLGVGGRVGFEFCNCQISAGANYGVLKVAKIAGESYHNLSVNLGIAYMF